MTEDEWLTCDDPVRMLAFLRGSQNDRKLIFFMVGVLRRCTPIQNGRREVFIRYEIAERYADGQVPLETVREVWGGQPSLPETPLDWAEALLRSDNVGVLLYGLPEARELSEALREVLGNPFRPVSVDPAWLTSTVVTLATGIYEQRAFDRMPILADALQDAGCENEDILNHCRGSGPHVRGCWVVDLLLGKS